MLRTLLAAVCLVFGTGAAHTEDAQSTQCAIALAFALDISTSVDDHEHRLQRAGLATALTDTEIREVILSWAGGVSLMAYEWSGSHRQAVIAPWQSIETDADLNTFAASLIDHPRTENEFPTAIGNAIAFGATMLDKVSFCTRLILDVSGDGAANDGFPPHSAYKHFPLALVTVNGLVVEGTDPTVHRYYLDNVIHGPGAFVETAAGYEDYARAMKRKLLRELQVTQFAGQ